MLGEDCTADRLAAAIDDAAISDAAVATHHQHVQTALETGCHSAAVMMLSAFYESAVSAAIEQNVASMQDWDDDVAVLAEYRLEALDQNRDGLASLLAEASVFDILDDTSHRLLDDLRDERNEYIHNADCLTRHDCAQADNATALHDLEASCNLYADILASSQHTLDGADLTTETSSYTYSVPGTPEKPWTYPQHRGKRQLPGDLSGPADCHAPGARPRPGRTAATA